MNRYIEPIGDLACTWMLRRGAGQSHAELTQRSGLPRSAVTGILSGSLQEVTIDRVLPLVDAIGLEAEIKVRRAA